MNRPTLDACIDKLLTSGGRFQASRSVTDPNSFYLGVIRKCDSEVVQKIVEAMNPNLSDDDYWAAIEGDDLMKDILAEERAFTPD